MVCFFWSFFSSLSLPVFVHDTLQTLAFVVALALETFHRPLAAPPAQTTPQNRSRITEEGGGEGLGKGGGLGEIAGGGSESEGEKT